MRDWTAKHILGLQHRGKIRSANIPENKPIQTVTGEKVAKKKMSKALTWLKWNLWYWANEHTVELKEEYYFDEEREFRFDFAFPSLMIAIEFEGGIFMDNSGHNTAKHFTKDTEKYNLAISQGWRVIRYTALNYESVLKSLNEMT